MLQAVKCSTVLIPIPCRCGMESEVQVTLTESIHMPNEVRCPQCKKAYAVPGKVLRFYKPGNSMRESGNR